MEEQTKNIYNTVFKGYFENGILKESCNSTSNRQDCISYSENGSKEGSITKIKRKYEFYISEKKSFYANGKLKEECKAINIDISNPPADMQCTEFYNNGTTKSIILNKSGVKSGLARFYYENGKLSEEGELRGETKLGIWKYYNSDGSLKNEADNTIEIKYLESNSEISKDTRITLWLFAYDSRRNLSIMQNLNSILTKEFIKKHVTLLFVVFSQSSNEKMVKNLIENNQSTYEFGNYFFITRDKFNAISQGKILAAPYVITSKNNTVLDSQYGPSLERLKLMIDQIKN